MPGTSTEQVVDKGIRQKSIHSFHSIHSFTDGSAFCPGGTEACSLGLRETPACIHVIQRFVTATSGMLTRLPAKLSKNGMRVYTLSDRRSKKKLRVYTASEAKGLTTTTDLSGEKRHTRAIDPCVVPLPRPYSSDNPDPLLNVSWRMLTAGR